MAIIIQYGGLEFLHELEFLSNKLLQVNPPSFHNIDPTTLPPKEITTTLKNARTDLIFESTSKGRKESCKGYANFGFESNEVDFVKAALNLLRLFAETTAPEFDPCLEDMKILEGSRPKVVKRHISFHKSAVLVKNAMKITKGTEGQRMMGKRFVLRSSPQGQARSRGRGGGGEVEPPLQNCLEVEKQYAKKYRKQINVHQPVLNSDAETAFSQPLIICLLPVSWFPLLTVCFYIQQQQRHSYLVNRK